MSVLKVMIKYVPEKIECRNMRKMIDFPLLSIRILTPLAGSTPQTAAAAGASEGSADLVHCSASVRRAGWA